MTFLHAHTQHQALKQWLAAACEMASKTNMAMQQSKCTIRTHCHRAQQTHNSQQRFPVNKKKIILNTHSAKSHQQTTFWSTSLMIIIVHHLRMMQPKSLSQWQESMRKKERETWANNSPSTYKAHWAYSTCWSPLPKHGCRPGRWPSGCDAVKSDSETENCALKCHQTQHPWVPSRLPATYDTIANQ